MKIQCEISRPHYHPGEGFDMTVTKKRDLSVPPHWVANERIEKDGKSYGIVMPPRSKELFEDGQDPHIHMPEYVDVYIGGVKVRAKIKLEPYDFNPVMHFDEQTAEIVNVQQGDITHI